MFKDRIARRLIILGIIFSMMACALVSNDQLPVTIGNRRRIFTKQKDPSIYWGTEAGLWFAGISLIALGFYRGQTWSGRDSSLESASKRYSRRMRIAAVVLALTGGLGLITLPQIFPISGNPKWPIMLFSGLLSIFYLWIGVGIWKRWFLTWRLGFVAIAISALLFFEKAWFDSSGTIIEAKPLFIVACAVGAILLGSYWSFIWYRQKKWFLHDEGI